jgi:MoxR-like ATPase
MTPPGAGENGIAPNPPQSLRSLRAVEAAETAPAPHTPKRPPHNLPLELSSFVGREKEIAEVKQLLADHRLLTLTGPGGCGKTRLALGVAREAVGRFEDGV